MIISTAKLVNEGVLINGSVIVSPNSGWLWEIYNAWLAEPNTPDPVETLLEAKDRRKQELAVDAQAAIVGGFVSSALGPVNTYISTEEAIQLLLLLTTASVADTLPRDVEATGTPTPHTTLQLLALNVDAEAHIAAQVANLIAKQAAVDAVPDTGDLPADIAIVDAVTF